LFHLLDEGPTSFHQPLLQIIYHILVVTIDICSENVVFRNKVPHWFASVAKFINSSLWNEALQILNTCLKQAEAGSMWLDYTVTGTLPPVNRREFSNQPQGNGNIQATQALEKVLETCKYSEKGKSIHHDISPTFWNKFFYEDFEAASNGISQQQIYPTKYSESSEEIQEEETQEQELRYIMDERMYDTEDMYTDDENVEDSKSKDQRDPEKTKFKFEHPTGFGRFPSFRGFEDILDFGDLELNDEDEENDKESETEEKAEY